MQSRGLTIRILFSSSIKKPPFWQREEDAYCKFPRLHPDEKHAKVGTQSYQLPTNSSIPNQFQPVLSLRLSQFGLREAIYSKEAGRFEVKCNEFGETARQLLESEVSLNIPSYVKLLYLTNCVADTPVIGIFSFFLCIGHLYFNEVNPRILVSNPFGSYLVIIGLFQIYLWSKLEFNDSMHRV